MKQYIKYLCLAILLPIVFYVPTVLLIWKIYSESVDLKVDDSKHLVVFGNSMGECSINDTILGDFNNCCTSGMTLWEGKNVYLSYLEQNKQVDTVFIALGEFTYVLRQNDDPNDEKINLPRFCAFADFIAYMGIEVFKFYRPVDVLCGFMSVRDLYSKPHYGFKYLERNNLIKEDADWGIAWFNKTYPVNVDSLSFDENLKDKVKLHSALEEIISYCNLTNRTVVIYNPPTYHIDNWIDDANYNKYLQTLNNVLIADYTYFELPNDNQYRGDVQHLNHFGAEYFCSYIKEHGWHFETPQQYYNRRMKQKSIRGNE